MLNEQEVLAVLQEIKELKMKAIQQAEESQQKFDEAQRKWDDYVASERQRISAAEQQQLRYQRFWQVVMVFLTFSVLVIACTLIPVAKWIVAPR